MRQLGFTGTIPKSVTEHVMEAQAVVLFEDERGPRTGLVGGVFPEQLTETIAAIRQQIAAAEVESRGQYKPKMHVGLNQYEIGSMTTLDDPDSVRMRQTPKWRRMMGKMIRNTRSMFGAPDLRSMETLYPQMLGMSQNPEWRHMLASMIPQMQDMMESQGMRTD